MSTVNQVNNLIQPKHASSGSSNTRESAGSGGAFMDVLTVEIKNTEAVNDKSPRPELDAVEKGKVNEPAKDDTAVDNDDNVKTAENKSENEGAVDDADQNDDAEKVSDSEQADKSKDDSAVKDDDGEIAEDIEPDQVVMSQVHTLVTDVQGAVAGAESAGASDGENVVETAVAVDEFAAVDNKMQMDNKGNQSPENKTSVDTGEAKAVTKSNAEGQAAEVTIDADVDEENKSALDITIDDSDAEDGVTDLEGEDKLLKQAQENLKTAEKSAENGGAAVEDKVAVKSENHNEKESVKKYDDAKSYDYDYKNASANASQQNQTNSGNSGKEHDQNKGFNYAEEIASVSGSANGGQTANDIKSMLGVESKAEDIKVDAGKTVDNVVKSVKTLVQNGNSTMVVRLDPPELGQLNIKISSDSNGMSIEIQATNAKTQQMLQQNSNNLRSALENSGINVNNVDVQFKPDVKNNANAGSDSNNGQQSMFDQNNNSFSGQGRNQADESYQDNNYNSWSDDNSFEESVYDQVQPSEIAAPAVSDWQELAFDTVDVTI